MKKLTLILVVLLTIGLVGAFAEEMEKEYPMVSLSGEFQHTLTVPQEGTMPAGNFGKAELNITGDVDEFNTVKLELDAEAGTLGTGDYVDSDGNVVDVDPSTGDLQLDNKLSVVGVDDFRLETDVTGALGLEAPVTVNTTVGYFDTYFTNWIYNTSLGQNFFYAAQGPVADGAIQVDLGIDPVTLHWYNDFTGGFTDFMVGASGSIADAGFFLTYSGNDNDPSKGTVYTEADYSYDVNDMTSVSGGAAFNYSLAAETYGWFATLGASYDMVSLGLDFGGDDVEMFRTVDVDLSADVTENASLYTAAYMDLSAADALQSMEFSASYGFGALTMKAGYALDPNGVGHNISGWQGSITNSGFFLVTDIDY